MGDTNSRNLSQLNSPLLLPVHKENADEVEQLAQIALPGLSRLENEMALR